MARWFILGRSGLGKTFFMITELMEIIPKMKPKPFVVLISPTAPYQQLYKKFKPYVSKHFHAINDVTVKRLLTWARSFAIKKNGKRMIIIIDDQGENPYVKFKKKNNSLNELVVCALHYKVHMFFLFQKLVQATTSLRINSDVIICFRLEDEDEKKHFWKDFAAFLPYDYFCMIAGEAWKQKFGYVKIIRNTKSRKPEIYIKKRKLNYNQKRFK